MNPEICQRCGLAVLGQMTITQHQKSAACRVFTKRRTMEARGFVRAADMPVGRFAWLIEVGIPHKTDIAHLELRPKMRTRKSVEAAYAAKRGLYVPAWVVPVVECADAPPEARKAVLRRGAKDEQYQQAVMAVSALAGGDFPEWLEDEAIAILDEEERHGRR